jgi:hypothetical protein
MDYRLKVDEWQNLTPAERVRRCRLMAEEVQALATAASSDMRHHYMKVAEQLLQLAIAIAREAARTSDAERS